MTDKQKQRVNNAKELAKKHSITLAIIACLQPWGEKAINKFSGTGDNFITKQEFKYHQREDSLKNIADAKFYDEMFNHLKDLIKK